MAATGTAPKRRAGGIRVAVNMSGFDQAIGELQAAMRATRPEVIESLLYEAAEAPKRSLEQRVPRKTGALARSVYRISKRQNDHRGGRGMDKPTPPRRSPSVAVRVGYYTASWLEKGTKAHTVGPRTGRKALKIDSKFRKTVTVRGTRGRRFVRSVAREARPQMEELMDKALSRRLKDLR